MMPKFCMMHSCLLLELARQLLLKVMNMDNDMYWIFRWNASVKVHPFAAVGLFVAVKIFHA